MFYVVLIILFVTIIISILFINNRYKHWQRRGIVGTKPTFFFGHLREFIMGKKNLAFVIDDAYKAFPEERFIGIFEFTKPNLIIKDPELIGDVLVKDFSYFHDRTIDPANTHRLNRHVGRLTGEKWNLVRTKLMPSFSTNKLKSMYSSMEQCCNILDSHLRNHLSHNDQVDVKEVLEKFTTDAVGNCIFGLEYDSLTNPNSLYFKISQQLFAVTPRLIIVTILRFVNPKFLKWFKISEVNPEVEKFFYNLLYHIEEFRKNKSFQRNNLAQTMLSIRDQEMEQNDKNKKIVLDNETIASNLYIMQSAGFETPATALGYCLYELALNPEIQEKVRKEIKDVREKNNGSLNFEALNDLVYMEMVLTETLRLYNPGNSFRRVCTKAWKVPNTSLILQRGDRITIPAHSIHHDEKYYPDPYKFNPERFSEENKINLKPFTFLAFGGGPRTCIGFKYAKMEMKLCLATLLTNYKISPCSKTEIPIVINPMTTQTQYDAKNGIWLRFTTI